MTGLWAGLAAGLFAIAATGASALTFSDDFEADPVAVPTGSLVNWVITGSIDVVGPSSFGSSCRDGSNCLDMDGIAPGRIDTKSTFNFVAGTTYTLAFDYSANGSNKGMTFGITNGLFSDQLTGVNSAGSNPYFNFSTTFTANGMGELFFESDSASGFGGVVLDNVSLTAAPVPLPAGLPLLLAGLGGLGLASRMRRKS